MEWYYIVLIIYAVFVQLEVLGTLEWSGMGFKHHTYNYFFYWLVAIFFIIFFTIGMPTLVSYQIIKKIKGGK